MIGIVQGRLTYTGEALQSFPKNPYKEFKSAALAKIDFIEIDLRIFSGSEKDLVLYHDSNLGKLEDPSGLLKLEGRRIEELSYNEIDDLTYRILGTEDQDIDRSVLFFSEFV